MEEFIATGWKRVEKDPDTGLKAAGAGVPEPGVEGMDLASLVGGAQKNTQEGTGIYLPKIPQSP